VSTKLVEFHETNGNGHGGNGNGGSAPPFAVVSSAAQSVAAGNGRLDGRYIQIVVHDTGPGIAKNIQDKIFEPFFTTKGQEGNGLGLAIVWGIIEGHDGRISVESEPGEGTTFTVLIPVADIPIA
jgi:signal transduction histidine kinase